MIEIIGRQPDDSSYDEILRELAFARIVQPGLDDSDSGRTVSSDTMKRTIDSWKDSWCHGGSTKTPNGRHGRCARPANRSADVAPSRAAWSAGRTGPGADAPGFTIRPLRGQRMRDRSFRNRDDRGTGETISVVFVVSCFMNCQPPVRVAPRMYPSPTSKWGSYS